ERTESKRADSDYAVPPEVIGIRIPVEFRSIVAVLRGLNNRRYEVDAPHELKKLSAGIDAGNWVVIRVKIVREVRVCGGGCYRILACEPAGAWVVFACPQVVEPERVEVLAGEAERLG